MSFSLVIPTIGKCPFLAEAVGSALDQTKAFDEILLFGNGMAADQLRRELGPGLAGRIRIISHEPRLPPHLSWNKAVESAAFSHVMLLGDDDLLLPSAHQVACDLLKVAPLATLGYEIINSQGRVCSRWVSARETSTPIEFYRKLYLGGLALMLAGVAFEKAAFTQVGGFQPTPFKSGWFIDTDLWTRLAFHAGHVAHSQGVDWRYRINAGQLGYKAGLADFAEELGSYLDDHRQWATGLGVPPGEILGGDVGAYSQRLLAIRAASSITNCLINRSMPSWRMLSEIVTLRALSPKTRCRVLWRSFRQGIPAYCRN